MFFHGHFDSYRNFLNAVHHSQIHMYVIMLTATLHIFWCQLFVDYLGYDIYGIGMATTVTAILNNILTHLACLHTKSLRQTFVTPSLKDAFSDLGKYMQMGLPSSLMMFLDWGLLEFFVFYSGFLGVVSNGSYVILNTLHSQSTFLCAGLTVGVLVCTGNSMGQKNYKAAQRFVMVAIAITFLLNGLLVTILLIFSEQFIKLMTT